MSTNPIAGSFRDPSGFLFTKDNTLYRQVNKRYREHFDFLISSGLYKHLTEKQMLVAHKEVPLSKFKVTDDAYKIIQPEEIPFISYFYEWSFSQLKAAALLTLEIAQQSLTYEMILKDATAFNIQFIGSRPILIDTLSFEKYEEGSPWIAYRQFCQHFLAPLSLARYQDLRMAKILRVFLDGVDLDLASKLLPGKTKFNFGILSHLHIHAGQQKKHSDPTVKLSPPRLPRRSLLALLDNLKNTISSLNLPEEKTQWSDYYDQTNYTLDSMKEKEKIVERLLKRINPSVVWDLGANTGRFSEIAAKRASYTLAFDVDAMAVEKLFLKLKKDNNEKILPLVMDLSNPSTDCGFAQNERLSLAERGPADCAMALALIHHLCITHNIPLASLAQYFSGLSKYLIIEFIHKDDSQVKKLLRSREDIFDNYTENGFEEAFAKYFKIEEKVNIKGTRRIVYLMKNNSNVKTQSSKL